VRFFLDHDVPAEAAQLLRHWGHEVTLLKEALPITAPDEEAFRYAREQGLVIISCNRSHFRALAEQAIHSELPFPGVIILLRRRSRQAECAHLLQLLRRAGETGLNGNINFA
jgi:predicted nuclease of predicted toxin-antitoxin system